MTAISNTGDRAALVPAVVDYPDSDGSPLGESDDHIDELLSARLALKDHFRHRADVYVASNLLLYYEEGNPQAQVAPDVFVAFGVPKHRRRTYKVWAEGRAPRCVIELTSKSTHLVDFGNKKGLYAMLGVSEYFLFDPLSEYLWPPLQGYRLQRGDYLHMKPGPGGVLESKTLGLRLAPRNGHLCFIDRRTGRMLATPEEGFDGLRRAEKEAVRAEKEASRAEKEAARAEKEAARAEKEAGRRRQVELRVEELERELARIRKKK
ncbi:MAG: Uma2 family endonuclease [Acidobacteriota bacterium]